MSKRARPPPADEDDADIVDLEDGEDGEDSESDSDDDFRAAPPPPKRQRRSDVELLEGLLHCHQMAHEATTGAAGAAPDRASVVPAGGGAAVRGSVLVGGDGRVKKVRAGYLRYFARGSVGLEEALLREFLDTGSTGRRKGLGESGGRRNKDKDGDDEMQDDEPESQVPQEEGAEDDDTEVDDGDDNAIESCFMMRLAALGWLRYVPEDHIADLWMLASNISGLVTMQQDDAKATTTCRWTSPLVHIWAPSLGPFAHAILSCLFGAIHDVSRVRVTVSRVQSELIAKDTDISVILRRRVREASLLSDRSFVRRFPPVAELVSGEWPHVELYGPVFQRVLVGVVVEDAFCSSSRLLKLSERVFVASERRTAMFVITTGSGVTQSKTFSSIRVPQLWMPFERIARKSLLDFIGDSQKTMRKAVRPFVGSYLRMNGRAASQTNRFAALQDVIKSFFDCKGDVGILAQRETQRRRGRDDNGWNGWVTGQVVSSGAGNVILASVFAATLDHRRFLAGIVRKEMKTKRKKKTGGEKRVKKRATKPALQRSARLLQAGRIASATNAQMFGEILKLSHQKNSSSCPMPMYLGHLVAPHSVHGSGIFSKPVTPAVERTHADMCHKFRFRFSNALPAGRMRRKRSSFLRRDGALALHRRMNAEAEALMSVDNRRLVNMEYSVDGGLCTREGWGDVEGVNQPVGVNLSELRNELFRK